MIRLNRITGKDGAIELLEEEFLRNTPNVETDPARFLIYANLAMAYHLGNEPRRAENYQVMALEAWPDIWPGWQATQLAYYRRCERYFLTLLRSRLREEEAGTGASFKPSTRSSRGSSLSVPMAGTKSAASLPATTMSCRSRPVRSCCS